MAAELAQGQQSVSGPTDSSQACPTRLNKREWGGPRGAPARFAVTIVYGSFVRLWGVDHSLTLAHYSQAFAVGWNEFGMHWRGSAWSSFWTTILIALLRQGDRIRRRNRSRRDVRRIQSRRPIAPNGADRQTGVLKTWAGLIA